MKAFIFLTIFQFIQTITTAQTSYPVCWTYDIEFEQTDPKKGKIILAAKILEGWKIFGRNNPMNGPVLLSIYFEEFENLNLQHKAQSLKPTVQEYSNIFELDLQVHQDEALYIQEFEIKDLQQPSFLSLNIEFMACNHEQCLPPNNYELETYVRRDPSINTLKIRKPCFEE